MMGRFRGVDVNDVGATVHDVTVEFERRHRCH